MYLSVQSPPPFDFYIAKMVEAEMLERKERKNRYVLLNQLCYHVMIEDVVYGVECNFTAEQLLAIDDCSFSRRHENLLIQGCGDAERPSGSVLSADKPILWVSRLSI